jgi:hypothetical protein
LLSDFIVIPAKDKPITNTNTLVLVAETDFSL